MPSRELPAFAPPGMDDRDAWSRIEKSPAVRAALEGLDKIPPRPPLPAGSDFLAARRTGDRARVDRHWQTERSQLTPLVFNRAVRGIAPADPDDRLLDWLFDLTFEPTWVVSAHLPGFDLPASGAPQLDLAACEVAMVLAEAREVLLPWMRGVSQTLDRSIIGEIDRRCLAVPDAGFTGWADTGKPSPNNWSGVCAGALLATCCSLEAQGHPRPEARKRMLRVLRYFFDKAFGEHGECDEGVGYWLYGVNFACLGLTRLPAAELRDAIDMRRLASVAAYPGSCHLVGRTFFAGNDTARQVDAAATTPWLAAVTGDSFLPWWSSRPPARRARTLGEPLRMAWLGEQLPPAGELSEPRHPPARYLPDQQVAIFQTTTPRGLLSFTLTGGHNAESHNHNDLGTFQVLLDEKPLVLDPGVPHYFAGFFGPGRYTQQLVAASGGHCCPSVNGFEQRAGAEAAGALVAYEPEARRLVLDLTAAYPAEAALTRWVRTGQMLRDGTCQIDDRFEASGSIVHRIWFLEEPRVRSDGVIETPTLHASLSPPPDRIAVQAFPAGGDQLRLREFPPDQLLYRVDAAYPVAAGSPLLVRTTIQLLA